MGVAIVESWHDHQSALLDRPTRFLQGDVLDGVALDDEAIAPVGFKLGAVENNAVCKFNH
jgi:hypothetical protein